MIEVCVLSVDSGMANLKNWHEMAVVLGVAGVVAGDELRCRCPLHNDTRPSFSMHIRTGRWICHAGCGQGEFSRLVELVLNCSVQAAREWVQDNGRQLAVEFISRELSQSLSRTTTEEKKVETGWLSYYESLSNLVMPLWFLNRGLTWETIAHWGIRFDPVQDAVVFPVREEGGIAGLIIRNATRMPKYQNSKGLPVSKLLFTEIKPNQNLIILVEGVIDAIWLWQLGYNAASLLGHELSMDQIAIIQKQRYGEVCLGLDNDQPGRTGTRAAVAKLQKAGYLLPQISYLKYPTNYKDSNDCTPEEISQAFNQRKERTLELLTIK